MSRYNTPNPAGRAVALRYDGSANTAPIVVASGMGYLAEKILEVAADNNVPVYEDNSLATMLSQLQLGQQIPDALFQAIVEIYVYFLNFDPNDPDKARRDKPPRPPKTPSLLNQLRKTPNLKPPTRCTLALKNRA